MSAFVPLYKQVAQRLFHRIQRGVYKYGDRIPSEKQLSDHYGVNRMTIRRAVGLLAEQGIVQAKQGKGVFVTDTYFEVPLQSDGPFFSECFFEDPRLRQELLFFQKVPAGIVLGGLFKIPSDAFLWLVGKRWLAQNMAVALEYTYLSVQDLPHLTREQCTGCHWKHLFPQQEMAGARLCEAMKAVRVFDEEAALLQLTQGEPALLARQAQQGTSRRVMRITNITAQGEKVVHYLKTVV